MAREDWKDKLASMTFDSAEQPTMAELLASEDAAPANEQARLMQEAPEQPKVKDLKNGSDFNGCLLVRSAEVRTGKTGRPYIDLKLCDKTG